MCSAPVNAHHLLAAVSGEIEVLSTSVGLIRLYCSDQFNLPSTPPLLLVHSVNAVGSAAEVEPLFEHYRQSRCVYAIDLPGFGGSDRSEKIFDPRLMTDALHAVISHISGKHAMSGLDVLALSLSAEFAARACVEKPDSIRRLAMVSPTGFQGKRDFHGPEGSTRFVPWLYRLLTWPAWSKTLFRLLTRPGVIRYFLKGMQGSEAVSEALWKYGVHTAQQPDAHHAPLHFLSGRLFSADVNSLYAAVNKPVWVSMATNGNFTDYRRRTSLAGRSNWQFHSMEGGALPYFEDLHAFTKKLDQFFLSTSVLVSSDPGIPPKL